MLVRSRVRVIRVEGGREKKLGGKREAERTENWQN